MSSTSIARRLSIIRSGDAKKRIPHSESPHAARMPIKATTSALPDDDMTMLLATREWMLRSCKFLLVVRRVQAVIAGTPWSLHHWPTVSESSVLAL